MIQTYNSRSLNFRFIRRLIGNIPRRSNEREISGQSNMKHKVFRCIETKEQIWEGCTAFKKALAFAVATKILAKAQRTQELRALAETSAIETSSVLKSPGTITKLPRLLFDIINLY